MDLYSHQFSRTRNPHSIQHWRYSLIPRKRQNYHCSLTIQSHHRLSSSRTLFRLLPSTGCLRRWPLHRRHCWNIRPLLPRCPHQKWRKGRRKKPQNHLRSTENRRKRKRLINRLPNHRFRSQRTRRNPLPNRQLWRHQSRKNRRRWLVTKIQPTRKIHRLQSHLWAY